MSPSGRRGPCRPDPARRVDARGTPASPSPSRPGVRRPAPTALAALVAAALQGVSPVASAQTAGATRLDAVSVTATRSPSRVDETVAEVTVIEREEIERARSLSFAELLARQPGLQIGTTGGPGQSASVFVRGLESRHTLLLVDGVRLGSALGGTTPFNNLPIEAFERVEIVRGPLSALYGSDAVGGVIQGFTRRARPGFSPNASLLLGTERTAQASAGFGFRGGAFDGAVQLTRFTTDGISATTPNADAFTYEPDRDGFRQTAGTLRLGWQLTSDWRLDATSLESRGTVRADEGPGSDPRGELRTRVRSLQASGRLADGWTTRLTAAASSDGYRSVGSAFGEGLFRTAQEQYAWENTVATPVGTAVALVERIEQRVDYGDFVLPTTRRSIDAVGLGLSGEAARHAWQLGARHDRNSQFGNQSTGSIGYGYALTPALRVGATYGTSFVAPDFGRLYFPGFSNPNLRPEEGRHAELAVRWSAGGHTLRAAWVDNRIEDYFVNGPGFVPINVDRARVDGAVLSYAGRLPGWLLGASYEHLDPRNDAPGDPNFGNRLQRRSKQALRASVDREFGAWSAGGTATAYSDRFEDAANTRRIGGFSTLDLRADRRIDRDWTVGLRLNNVADKRYETALGFAQLGRSAYVVLSWAPPSR